MEDTKSFSYRFKTLNELTKNKDIKNINQKIGHQFERLIQDILFEEKLLLKRGYHTIDNKAEQIDGVLEVYGRILLLEVKWVNKDLAASSLFSFIGKIENKLEGTLGLFVSRNELSENFIRAVRKGRRQNVIIIDGECLEILISRNLSFKDYIVEAIKYLSFQNAIRFPIQMFLNKSKYDNSSDLEKDIFIDAKTFITDNIYNNERDTDLLAAVCKEFSELNTKTKSKIYDIIVDEFQENLWERGPYVTGGNYRFSYLYTNCAALIFNKFPPGVIFLNDLALTLFTKLLPSQLEKYSNSFLVDITVPYYNGLDNEIKTNFEKELIVRMNNNSDYYLENSITYLIEKLWNEFSSETSAKIKAYYLDVFLSNRDIKFKQKSFSIDLLEHGKTNLEDIYRYIRDLIKRAKYQDNLDSFRLHEYYKLYHRKLSISNKEFIDKLKIIYTEESKNRITTPTNN